VLQLGALIEFKRPNSEQCFLHSISLPRTITALFEFYVVVRLRRCSTAFIKRSYCKVEGALFIFLKRLNSE